MDYIANLIPDSIKSIPTHMDFDGQRRAERYFQAIIILFAVVGFVWGYITQLFSMTLYILFAGVVFSCLLTLIPWEMYRKHPLPWQPARDEGHSPNPPQHQQVSGGSQAVAKSKKKKAIKSHSSTQN